MVGNKIGNWKRELRHLNTSLTEEMKWHYKISDDLPWDNIVHRLKKKSVISAFQRYEKLMKK